MEMISADSYIKERMDFTVDKLIAEKHKLEKNIDEMENQIVNNIPDIFNGGRDTKLKMNKECLQKIDSLINLKENK